MFCFTRAYFTKQVFQKSGVCYARDEGNSEFSISVTDSASVKKNFKKKQNFKTKMDTLSFNTKGMSTSESEFVSPRL